LKTHRLAVGISDSATLGKPAYFPPESAMGMS
jgi:hypothetical protein